MKKRVCLLLSLALIATLTACGNSTGTPTQEADVKPEAPPLTESEIKQMYSDPSKFIDRQLELTGQVFTAPEYDEDGVYFQMWGDPENWDLNTIVAYPDPEMELEEDEYVRITGYVASAYEGENMMGGKISAPMITADTVEIVSYIDAVSPTLHTAAAETNSIDQYGYVVTIEKAELAESETRVYVTITNNGKETFGLRQYSSKIIQNGKQYEHETNFSADYPEVQDDLSVGVTTEGIITFPAIEAGDFQLILPGSSGNWKEDISDYTFDLTIQE